MRLTATFLLIFCAAALAQEAAPALPALAAFSSGTGAAPPAPWRVVGLPGNKAPLAQIDLTLLDGQRVLRLRTDKSYGTLTHPLPAQTQAASLKWRWRLDQAMPAANLQRKDGDDAPLKVCAMFDLSLEKIPFFERSLLRLARSVSGEALPGATVCYVWDHSLPSGTVLPNAYTRRVRFIVVDSGEGKLQQWQTHTRDLRADFARAFGAESDTVPPLLAIVLGADSDNTASTSLGYVGDVTLVEQ
jgi:hypothetical protein